MTDQPTTLSGLAKLVDGQLTGDAALAIHGAATLREVSAGQITLVDRPEKLERLAECKAAAVVLPAGMDCDWPAVIHVDDVHAAFAKIVTHFRPRRERAVGGVSPSAVVSPTAKIGRDATIQPGVTIGDDCRIGDGVTVFPGTQIMAGCTIGRGATIGPNAVLYEDTIVGERVIIHGGAVIGCHGFGYHVVAGRHVPAPQLGYVRIGNDVEIGAATTIDRGTYGATTIGDGTKIDNLVQIAHNCQIGKHNLICAQVGVAGSTSTGDYVVIGGQAGLRDHVHIGSRAMLSAMAGITNDVPDGAVMMGIPATPEREQKIKLAALAKLPQMRKEFRALRAAVARLEKAAEMETNKSRDAERAA
jgi:UDP-3-O-[3-hydroxymyristoyl] glucosamine N-acyltransferase